MKKLPLSCPSPAPQSFLQNHSLGYEQRQPRDFVAKLLAQRLIAASHVNANHASSLRFRQHCDMVAKYRHGVQAGGSIHRVNDPQVEERGEEVEGVLEWSPSGFDHST
mmetsp:Transcript_4751/g.17252  ORF Transcript_4751/g.17252 Transcript_4751/m.17252 type:complete len:108 (+) Transcript_4751:3-326(+)